VPEYLAPGVYVEEVSYSAPTIEGVGTTTTGFAGPTLTGPVSGMPYGGLPASNEPIAGSPSGGIPQLLTSFGDFQNIYGGYGNLSMALSPPNPYKNVNYMAMAVKAFFDNGGSMLYVSRVYANSPGTGAEIIDPGIATSGVAAANNVVVSARFPGAYLNGQTVTVTLTAAKTQNISSLPQYPNLLRQRIHRRLYVQCRRPGPLALVTSDKALRCHVTSDGAERRRAASGL
jgi:phage tail sheath protein FI